MALPDQPEADGGPREAEAEPVEPAPVDRRSHPGRQQLSIALAVAAVLPGVALRLSGAAPPSGLAALAYGGAIVGSAFLLSWAAEAAQVDISAGLAISIIALIAVLPEYAVDAVFAIKGGHAVRDTGPACLSPTGGASPCSLALANMTGGNRLLIGVGWPLVVLIACWQWRTRGRRVREVRLDRTHSVELSYLAVACAYSLTLPLKRTITLVDSAILVAIFVSYTIRVSRAPADEPHLVGPASYIGSRPAVTRRVVVVVMLVAAAGVILLCAEHFADALVDAGRAAHIDEFLLVQWLAPLASEAPELLVAGVYAWRLNTSAGLGTLVSSKVNQWTLLVGTLPVIFALASGTRHGLPILAMQREELLLTAAQSVFAVAVLASLSLSAGEASVLLGLFLFQFVASGVVVGHDTAQAVVLVGTSVVYLVLAALILLGHRHRLSHLLRDGFTTPYATMVGDS